MDQHIDFRWTIMEDGRIKLSNKRKDTKLVKRKGGGCPLAVLAVLTRSHSCNKLVGLEISYGSRGGP
jgi:hypothetical protein